jgi:hypothetical protein
MQLFTTESGSWFLFYDKLPSPTCEKKRYSDDEVDQLASRVAEVYVTDKLQFKDIWNVRKWAMLADLPEGILKKWSWNRIVLVGDAASKQTPSLGQGWNCGVQDVVVLANRLRSSLEAKQGDSLSTEELVGVFQGYQESRIPNLRAWTQVAAGTTRAATWSTWSGWIKDRFIIPWTGGSKERFRQHVGALISKGHFLEFLPENKSLNGAVEWVHTSKFEPGNARK